MIKRIVIPISLVLLGLGASAPVKAGLLSFTARAGEDVARAGEDIAGKGIHAHPHQVLDGLEKMHHFSHPHSQDHKNDEDEDHKNDEDD
jgi:hypothetical protein